MVRTIRVLGLGLAVLCLGACAMRVSSTTTTVVRGGAAMDLNNARMAEKLEVTLDNQGYADEIEYHIPPSAVPDAVRAAMDALAEGEDRGAEKEWNDGRLYYELMRIVDGKEWEAMFLPDGTLHEIEAQVDAAEVPQAAQDAVAAMWPNASDHSWEVIKDGALAVVEYHVKMQAGGQSLKVVVTTGGTVTKAFREVVSEIEVPIRLP